MIVSKRCQPLPTAKAAFTGGSGETSQALGDGTSYVLVESTDPYDFFLILVYMLIFFSFLMFSVGLYPEGSPSRNSRRP